MFLNGLLFNFLFLSNVDKMKYFLGVILFPDQYWQHINKLLQVLLDYFYLLFFISSCCLMVIMTSSIAFAWAGKHLFEIFLTGTWCYLSNSKLMYVFFFLRICSLQPILIKKIRKITNRPKLQRNEHHGYTTYHWWICLHSFSCNLSQEVYENDCDLLKQSSFYSQ